MMNYDSDKGFTICWLKYCYIRKCKSANYSAYKFLAKLKLEIKGNY